MKFIPFIITVLIAQISWARLSALRPETEDYRVKASKTIVYQSQQFDLARMNSSVGPLIYGQVIIPEFPSIETMQLAFTAVRDRKNLRWLKMPESTRRNTYLYPIDGCFMRAALMNKNLKANRIKPLPKIYAFGNLNIKTRYAKGGKTAWYFHVALITKVGQEDYVFDPSMDYNKPMKLDSWLAAMSTNRNSADLRVCDADNYSPFETCVGGHGFYEEADLANDIERYLSAEWYNLINLGLDPQKLLDESPPWEK